MSEEHVGYTKDGKKIEYASSKKINKLKEYVDEILSCLGHPEAWVSDPSRISDFMYSLDSKEKQEAWLQDLAGNLGFEVKPEDFLYQVAQRLKDNDI